MLIEKETAKKKSGGNCTVFEYGGTEKLDLAKAEIKGRYPEKGWARNKTCTMLYYILEGSGEIRIEEENFTVEEGDVVIFEPGKKYFCFGNFSCLIASAPAWTPEQYEMIE